MYWFLSAKVNSHYAKMWQHTTSLSKSSVNVKRVTKKS